MGAWNPMLWCVVCLGCNKVYSVWRWAGRGKCRCKSRSGGHMPGGLRKRKKNEKVLG